MTIRRFPILPTHTAALACFCCAQNLGADVPGADAGYPDRYGRYRKMCPGCGCRTYYDLEPATVAAIAVLETAPLDAPLNDAEQAALNHLINLEPPNGDETV